MPTFTWENFRCTLMYIHLHIHYVKHTTYLFYHVLDLSIGRFCRCQAANHHPIRLPVIGDIPGESRYEQNEEKRQNSNEHCCTDGLVDSRDNIF